MIIFNTTYLVSPSVESKFITWIKEIYVPRVKELDLLKNPRFMKVLTDEKDGISFSLQWEVDALPVMRKFRNEHLPSLERSVSETFGESALFFSTYLNVYDL